MIQVTHPSSYLHKSISSFIVLLLKIAFPLQNIIAVEYGSKETDSTQNLETKEITDLPEHVRIVVRKTRWRSIIAETYYSYMHRHNERFILIYPSEKLRSGKIYYVKSGRLVIDNNQM